MAFQMGNGSGSGGGSGCSEENGGCDSHNGRKNCHRHTPEQIQRLESFFKICPHPDENQRRQLGVELRMEPRQIKFWFQNKRTQMKSQNERADNNSLRSENDKFRSENMAIREALKTLICPSCGGPPPGEEEKKQTLLKLRQENAKLKMEYERISNVLANYMGRPLSGDAAGASHTGRESRTTASEVDSLMGNINVGDHTKANPEIEKSLMSELASNAMDELIKLLNVDRPLWIKSPGDDQYILDRNNYEKIFPRCMGLRYPKSRLESSKDSGVVVMNARSLVDLCLDPDKWVDFFPTVVAKTRTLRVIEAGLLGSRSGSLQLIHEQMHILSPLVQPREFYVLRYCQQIESGKWVIVDVSCDYLRGNSPIFPTCCWKRPSGWMIEELSGLLTKVTCIEHVEVDDRLQVHPIYEDLVKSALGFGAKKWIVALQRACERFTYIVQAVRSCRELGAGRRSMIMLACRAVKSYCSIFSFLGSAEFRQSSEMTNNRIRVAARKNTCRGEPVGIVILAAASFWVPAPHERVLEYLTNHIMRSQWDVLCYGNPVSEIMHLPTGIHSANRISILQPQGLNENIVLFQETTVEQLGSLLVYAPIDLSTMKLVTIGANSKNIPILSSGFAITTDGPDLRAGASTSKSIVGPCGSLITVAFQILASSSLSADKVGLDVISTIDAFVNSAVELVKSAFFFPA